jgi:hypothetical protein
MAPNRVNNSYTAAAAWGPAGIVKLNGRRNDVAGLGWWNETVNRPAACGMSSCCWPKQCVIVSYGSVRRRYLKFGRAFAAKLRKRRPRPGDTWHLDEVFVRMERRTALSLAPSPSMASCSTSSCRIAGIRPHGAIQRLIAGKGIGVQETPRAPPGKSGSGDDARPSTSRSGATYLPRIAFCPMPPLSPQSAEQRPLPGKVPGLIIHIAHATQLSLGAFGRSLRSQ